MEIPLSKLRGAAQGELSHLGSCGNLNTIITHSTLPQSCIITLYLPALHRHGLPLFSSLLIFSRFSTFTSFSFFKSSVPLLGAISGKIWPSVRLTSVICVLRGSVGLRNADLVWPGAFIWNLRC